MVSIKALVSILLFVGISEAGRFAEMYNEKTSDVVFAMAANFPNLNFSLTPEQISTGSKTLIDKTRAEILKLAAIPSDQATFETVLRPLALIEGQLTTNSASYTFPQQVSTSEEIRNASTEASKLLDAFAIEASTNKELFAAVRAVSEKPEELGKLNAEDRRFLDKVLLEFKDNGLYLESEEALALLKSKRQRLADIAIEYERNISEDKSELKFTKEQLDGAPQSLLDTFTWNEVDKTYTVTMKYPDYFGVMSNVKVESTRKLVSETYLRRSPANRALLDETLKLRQESAEILGYPNHAAFVLKDRMAKDPKAAETFLQDLRAKLTPFGEKELIKLKELKAADLNTTVDKVDFQPWDFGYYRQMQLNKELNFDPEVVREYFSLDHVVEKMFEIYQEILGLRFKEITVAAEGADSKWNEDVKLYEVTDAQSGELVGHFYLDLFPHPGKFSHAAVVPLLPGYLLNKETGERQTAVAALVANFPKSTATSPSLLRHNDVITLFHEFGHVMHELNAKANISRFSGARVERDFVEAPSQMLENWVWDEQILARLSQHYQRTEESLPKDLLDKLVASKNLNAGLLNLYQVFYALYDLIIHSNQIPADETPDTLYELMKREISLLPQPDNVWPMASSVHVMGYDAGYYGYLWSQVFSADMFYSRFKAEGIQSARVGRDYREKILGPGGSRDGMASLVDFLGREPIQEPFLKSLGLL